MLRTKQQCLYDLKQQLQEIICKEEITLLEFGDLLGSFRKQKAEASDPHTLLTPGTPDLTEDKQRARAILQNYTLDAAKLDVLPMWLFDKNKIKNKQLRDWKTGKMIEGEGLDAHSIIPLTKPAIHQFSQGIMQELETNAQKALATPEIQQDILFHRKRTAMRLLKPLLPLIAATHLLPLSSDSLKPMQATSANSNATST